MKKLKYYLLFFLIPFLTAAQDDNQGQSIELPDFVITGVQNVTIPAAKKKKAELISTISHEFIRPGYSPEEFTLSELSSPIKTGISLFNDKSAYHGNLRVGAGRYSLPVGLFNYSKSFESAILTSKVWGSNITEFVDNAGYNVSGLKLGGDFFVSDGSEFLPGLTIGVNGGFYRDSYKFFASANPEFKRETQHINSTVSVLSTLIENVNFGMEFDGYFLRFKENKLQENLFSTNGFFAWKLPRFSIEASGFYLRQSFQNNLWANNNADYFGGEGNIVLTPSNNIQVKVGAYYAKQDSNSFFAPQFTILFKLDKFVSLIAEYSPHTEFMTQKYLLSRNKYFTLGKFQNIFIEHKNHIKIAVQYQYETYFEITGGFGYNTSNKELYFEDNTESGMFEPQLTEDGSRMWGFVKFLFHLGPFGTMYAEAEFQDNRNIDDYVLPYQSPLTAALAYRYMFDFGLTVKPDIGFASNAYTNLINTEELPNFIDLNLLLEYQIFDNLSVYTEFNNILNRENPRLRNYIEKPFDVIGGINYRW